MKRIAAISVVIGSAILMSVVLGLAGWHAHDRVGMIQTLCHAGLPNLSRPSVVDANILGCDVLGEKQRLTGFISSSFENATFIIGDHVETASEGYFTNESAWYWTTEGSSQRGGDALSRELKKLYSGLCGDRVAKVEIEGWMTVSPGKYGHLGGWEREVYIYRVISATSPAAEDLDALRLPEPLLERHPGFAKHCAEMEREEGHGS